MKTERFDIEEDEGKQPNFSYGKHREISTIEKVQKAEEIPDHHGCKEERQDEQRQGPAKRKPRKARLNVIPDHIYQSWQQDTSDIRRRKTTEKERKDALFSAWMESYMELPIIKFIEREINTNPSSELGHGIPPLHAEVNPGRSNKKRPYSSSRDSLEPVAEEPTWQFTEPKFKISRPSENGPNT